VCLITLAGIEGSSDVAIGHSLFFHCVSTLSFEHAVARRRETQRAGCALIKRPHLSAVSFLKSDADSSTGTDIAVQPFASSEEAELWGPGKGLSSQPAGAKHGAFSRFLSDALRFNDLRPLSPPAGDAEPCPAPAIPSPRSDPRLSTLNPGPVDFSSMEVVPLHIFHLHRDIR
jgi:hypothetical protein